SKNFSTVQKRRIIDKVELHSGALPAAHHRTEAVAVVEGNGDAANHLLGLLERGLTVEGHIHADLVSGAGQGPRQRSHDVSHPAGFGEWHTFRSGKNYVHESDSLK